MRAVWLRAVRAGVVLARRCEARVASPAHTPGSRVHAMREWARWVRAARYAARRAGVRVGYLEYQ